jgi:hypothetical protein
METPVPYDLSLFSELWAAQYNAEVWGAPSSGMYPVTGANSKGTEDSGGGPHSKPRDKEDAD